MKSPAALAVGGVVAGVALVVALALGSGFLGANNASAAPAVPHFVEEAVAGGVSHSYQGEFEYYVGGGVAVFDCNGDRLPDLYFAGGSAPAALYRNVSPVGGALQFDQVADPQPDLAAVTGAYPLDFDGDGQVDLAVLRVGEDVLLRGLGGCRFERANDAWSFDGGDSWTTAFSARWDDGRQFPTIAVGHYLTSTDPNEFTCADNQLFRAATDGIGFDPPEPLAPGWCTLSMLFSDWDRSGRGDLRVTNDRHYYGDTSDGEEQLWRVPADGEPTLYTAADGWQRVRIWGMGIASYDVTGDGYPDYYLTSQGDNKLQTLTSDAANPEYRDIALSRDATATRPFNGDTTLPSTAWHDEFADVNNDGFVDLFVAKGNVEAMPDFATRDPSNLMLGRADGMFVESAAEAGFVDFARARGGAVADLNADGLLDMVVVTRRENVRIWRNLGSSNTSVTTASAGPMGNWIEVTLADDGSNRNAIGSWIEVRMGNRTQTREVTIGGGHVSGQLGPAHLGLGGATNAELRVTWPNGEVGPWQAVSANERLLVERGAPVPVTLP